MDRPDAPGDDGRDESGQAGRTPARVPAIAIPPPVVHQAHAVGKAVHIVGVRPRVAAVPDRLDALKAAAAHAAR